MSKEKRTYEVQLVETEAGLTLTGEGLSVRGDFTSMLPRLRQDRLSKELLVKAAKIKGIEGVARAVDATAGLGEDSVLLAAAGFDVTLFECNSTIAALLADALERACEDPVLSPIAKRMHLIEGDSIQGLKELDFAPEVILLDPMFPEKRKSAVSKKKMQLIQQLEKPCSSEEALLRAALDAAPKKIVVKRPLKGPHLAGIKPDYSLGGKTIRYDCLTSSIGHI